jgi:hypothetical protein
MSEAAAVLLDRSLRLAEHETALEVGWLLQELEQRFNYSLEELARRFDRSVSWVSRRLALVELLPEAIQQQVREGKIAAQAQDLFDEMYASLADRSTRQLLKRLARLDVLLVDELGYLNLKPEQSNIFFKLMEERYPTAASSLRRRTQPKSTARIARSRFPSVVSISG